MSQTAQIVIAVIVLAVVASMAAKAISAATRALSSLVGFAAIVFVVCLLAGVDVSAWFRWVDLSRLPDLNAWLAKVQS